MRPARLDSRQVTRFGSGHPAVARWVDAAVRARTPAGNGPAAPGYPRGTNTAVGTTEQAPRSAPRRSVPAQQGSVAPPRRTCDSDNDPDPDPNPANRTAPVTDPRLVAVALADAALAGPWDVESTGARMVRAVGRRQVWLARLATELMAAYPRPPADRPRELARFVLQSNAFELASTSPRGLPGPRVFLPAPTSTVRAPFPTPRIDNAGELAELLGIDLDELATYADTRMRARRAHSPRIANYRYRWLERPGGARLLEAPRSRLAARQRQILDELLAPIPVHPACHGFVAGRSVLTGARRHVGAQVLVTLDLEQFFASVTAPRIWGVLRAAGYPEPVAHLLTGLTTHAAPIAALADMPRGPDPSRDFRLRRRLGVPHLPQGAATSPQLANLVLYSLDRRLAALAEAAGLAYTRYADDLTFSGGPDLRRGAHTMITTIEKIVRAESFALNPAKTRVRQRHQRQSVTGIVVNQRLNIARPEYDLIKAILHDCSRHGPAAANRTGEPDFRAHLLGRISWITSVNTDRGGRLRARFAEIDWPD